ncbi:aminotransferase class V-fold PLP-dependent enzyme [Chelativorans xinjiangense]|uniref:aminotransferase class V-fold PLP-dependent enzyme n=1 Tax=Chelativorans xinjiangense TaxID=2681485 RepID=UPI00135A6591|nr:aminotransferase class V-fold PLP-dependent enzyme [Chelativorans xinjiangense]
MLHSNIATGQEHRNVFEDARRRFPRAANGTYLDVAANGLLSVDSVTAIERHLDTLRDGRLDKRECFERVESCRGKIARLIKAEPDEVAFTKNVSDGLNIIAAAMDWRAGDNIVLCMSLEHLNNVFPWLNLERRRGIEVRAVADRSGAIDIDAMIGAIDERTRLVTLSPVTFAPGLAVDVTPLGKVCRGRGIFLLADGAQWVGASGIDVGRMQVDGLAASTQKGLLGLYGLGFLYCRREWAEKLNPVALARFSVDLGSGTHEASMGNHYGAHAHGRDYVHMPGARRFDIGNYNYPAIFALEPSLDLLLEIGTGEIENHTRNLAVQLTDGVRRLGLPVCADGAIAGASRPSHIVTVGRFSRTMRDNEADPELAGLYRFLRSRNVGLTIRRGMLRFSMHLYNNSDDIERVLGLIKSYGNGAIQSQRTSW